jgi:predicted AlkP superfamily pyrophosphatase or phosphodiesterase
MTSRTKILLIGIDGLILQRAIDSGRAATLATLRAESYFSEMVVDMPTVSGPSWTTLLTGVTQQVHKVIDPSDVGPVIRTRVADQSTEKHSIFIRDGETNGYETVDVEVAQDAVRAIRDIAPDVSFVYFCGADEAGHLDGTIEGSYFDAIERIDRLVAQLYQAIHIRNQMHDEEWLIVITTDHGHRDEGGHGGDSPQERASFVIAHGVGVQHPSWPAQIKPEELVGHLLSTL